MGITPMAVHIVARVDTSGSPGSLCSEQRLARAQRTTTQIKPLASGCLPIASCDALAQLPALSRTVERVFTGPSAFGKHEVLFGISAFSSLFPSAFGSCRVPLASFHLPLSARSKQDGFHGRRIRASQFRGQRRVVPSSKSRFRALA